MMELDIGIEAALNVGVKAPPAGGSAAGSGAASNAGAVLPPERAADEGQASFRAALREASGENRIDKDPSAPAHREPAPDGRNAPCEVSEAGPLRAEDPPLEAQTNEAPVETQTLGSSGLLGLFWIGRVPVDATREMPAPGPADGGTEPHAAEDGIPAEGSEPLETLIRYPLAATDGLEDDAALTRVQGEPIEPSKRSLDSGPRPALTEATADPGSAPELALSEMTGPLAVAEEGAPPAQTREGQALGEVRELSGQGGAKELADRRALETSDFAPVLRRLRAPLREPAAAYSSGQPAAASEASPAPSLAVSGAGLPSGAADMATANGAALRAPHSFESTPANQAADSFRQAETAADSGGQISEGRQGASAESGDFRHAADDFLFSKMPAAGKAVRAEGEALPEGVAAMTREARWFSGTEAILETPRDSASVPHDKETVAGTGRAGVFEQIVQRAAVHLKNDQGEINIDLKPDFLGRVRMQITTESQQVTVRILTELATVRDMIEIGLPQLKSELQSQGLQVERLEVAVADDQRPRDRQQPHPAQGWKAAAAGDGSSEDPLRNEERTESIYYRPRSAGAATIDMFV
jgi:flagellar hook-length control protein FliK